MEFFPTHSIQLFNLFWFPLIYGIASLFVMSKFSNDTKKRMLTFPKYKNKYKKVFSILFMIIFGKLIIIYSVFVPIQANSFYFYIGLIIYSIGIFCSIYGMYIFSKADLSHPVTTGIYKYTRHPMQVMYYFSWIGLGFISGTWIFIIYAIIFSILAIPSLIAQEKDCIEKYGDEYRKYLEKTPRFIFFI